MNSYFYNVNRTDKLIVVSNSKALRLCKGKFLKRNIWTLVRAALPLFYRSCTVWISATTEKIIPVQIPYSSQKATATIWSYEKANHIPMAHF